MEKQFKISVIIPIYNTEKYLNETIKSVINQSMGFLENIQIILVNNATQDQSEHICLEYIEKYPFNIEYIKLDVNRGPCSARNAGQSVARGKYINFLDSDDQWEKGAFEEIYNYFEKHYDEIDFVAGRIRRFEKYEEWDLFDFKFQHGNKIVDVKENPSFVQFSLSSVFIKAEIGKKYIHDERIFHAEDMKYLTEILFNKCKYGIVSSAVFKYRVRVDGDSVFQTTIASRNWYYETLKYSYFYLMEESEKRFGYIIPYLQYILHSEIRGRLLKTIPNDMDAELKVFYLNGIKKIIKAINDKIILQEERMSVEQKLYTLKLKYETEYQKYLSTKNREVYFEDFKLLSLEELIVIRNALVLDDFSIMEGYIRYPYDLGVDIHDDLKILDDNQHCCNIQKMDLEATENQYSLEDKLTAGYNFLVSIPIKESTKIYFTVNGIRQKIKLMPYAAVNRLNYEFKEKYIQYTPYMKNRFPAYFLFPFEKIEKNSKIIIYGAGYVGTQYYEQIKKTGYCQIVGVADSNADKISHSEYSVYTFDFIIQSQYDYIVIAIGKRKYAEEVKGRLIKAGVDINKIICEYDRNIIWR